MFSETCCILLLLANASYSIKAINVTITQKCILILGYVRGIEKIWIIGDDFAQKSFEQHYRGIKGDHGFYSTFAFEHYEIREFLSGKKESHIRSAMGRIRSNLYRAFDEQAGIPKLIVVIIDDDILRDIYGDSEDEVLDQVHPLMSWLLREFERGILAFKDVLPNKAKRQYLPHTLWISPPTHKYFGEIANLLRRKTGEVLRSLVETKLNMSCLSMIKIWNYDDTDAFVQESYRFTSDGYRKYWLSVDSAIRFWCTAIGSKMEVRKTKNFKKAKTAQNTSQQKNFYGNKTWYNNKNVKSVRRRIPTPP